MILITIEHNNRLPDHVFLQTIVVMKERLDS